MRPLSLTLSVAAVATPLIAATLLLRTGAPVQARPEPPRKALPPVAPPILRPRLTYQDGDTEHDLGIAKAEVAMRVDGPLAQTTLTLTFHNDTNRLLEGNLDFPLPENAVLSGYALDVNGAMIDGVPVEKNEARQIFETEERHRVDPGLLEQKGSGNNFRTRIYPLPPLGTRTIRITYVSDLQTIGGRDLRYTVPLRWGQTIPSATFSLTIDHDPVAPELSFGGRESVLQITPNGGGFLRAPSSYTMQKTLANVAFDNDLTITLPGLGAETQVAIESFRHLPVPTTDLGKALFAQAGEDYFAIADAPPRAPTAPIAGFSKSSPHIGIVWDASLSRLHADRRHELQLLSDALHGVSRGTIDVTILRNVAEPSRTFVVENGNSSALVSYLNAEPCDGGTDLSALRFPRSGGGRPYDAYLLFTDGLDTLGGDPPGAVGAPIYAVATDPRANHTLLRRLSERSGGAYLNLAQMTDPEAVAAMGRTPYSLLTVAITRGEVSDISPDSAAPIQGRIMITGRLKSDEAELALVYGYRNLINGNDQTTARKTVTLRHKDSTPADGIVARYWARQKANALGIQPDKNHAALIALGHDFNIVTPTTSFLVLENLQQYITYNVQPPASQPTLLTEWGKQHDATIRQDREARHDKLANVISAWNGKVAWYKNPPKPEKAKVPVLYSNERRRGIAVEEQAVDSLAAHHQRYDQARPAAAAPMAVTHASAGLVPVTQGGGFGGAGSARTANIMSHGFRDANAVNGVQIAGIEREDQSVAEHTVVKAWSPDTPYLKALRQAGPANAYTAYLQQRSASGYENSPAFYLDCAEYLIGAGQTEKGVRVLTSILDLKIEEPSLVRIVAHRLTQLGYRDAGIRLFDQVLRMRPEEPQSYRDLALALADRADDEMAHASPASATADDNRALTLLNNVVTMPVDNRFPGIETIVLMEANRIATRAKDHALTLTNPIDSRLTRNLPCDLRILLTWNTDETDQDLWVTEPTGEKCYYAYNRTTIGGRLSNDFTQGYGPEEYLLRKAVHGKYVIQTNYYGQHSPEIDGGTTVQATVITNWGRPTEQRKYLTVRVNQAKDVVDIGEVVR